MPNRATSSGISDNHRRGVLVVSRKPKTPFLYRMSVFPDGFSPCLSHVCGFLPILLILSLASPLAMAALPQPVAKYTFNARNANDTSGYGAAANGIASGATFVSDGAGGYRLRMRGTDYVNFGTPAKLNLGGAGTTESFAFWMCPTNTTAKIRDVLRKGTTGYRLRYNESNRTIEFSHLTDDSDFDRAYNSEWNISIVRGGNIPPNQWHHVVGVYDAGNDFLSHTPSFALYVDGKLVAMKRGANVDPYIVGDPVYMGWSSDGFIGYLDDVCIYNVALNIAQVRELANASMSQAWNPYPNGIIAQAAATGTILSWNSGTNATAHKVYFGTNSTPGSGEYKGQQTTNTFNPGNLVPNTTYYWRVDEVVGTSNVLGDVWSFKAAGGRNSSVAGNGGVYEINVDGNWDLDPNHCTSHVKNYFVDDFTKAGTEGHEFGINMPGADYPPYDSIVWIGTNSYNFYLLDNAVERILAKSPNARIMVRASGIAPPQWWLNSHPNEWELIDNGTNTSAYFGDSNNNPRSGPFASLASTTYRDEMAGAWRDIIKYIEQAGYADHIVGYSLGGLRTGESYAWDCDRNEVMGYSDHFKAGFRNWLRARYTNDLGALRSAWNDGSVTFEAAQPPSQSQCAAEQPYKTFRTAPERVRVVDFYRYKSELIVETYDYFAGVIKGAHSIPKYVICYYGMMNEFEGRDKFGHNALHRVCSATNLDGIIVTASYTDRWFRSGLDMERAPSYSLQLNGKFWHNDNDMATYLSDYSNNLTYGEQQLGWTHNETDTRRMMRRAAGFSLAKNMRKVWFELQEGIYNNSGLLAEVASINQMFNDAATRDCSSSAQILLVCDEVSNSFCPWNSTLTRDTLRSGTYEFNRLGAPFDQILLTDLNKINASRYKLVVFMNCYNCFDDQRQAISNLKNSGRTLVFVYGSGYFNNISAGTSNMNDLTSLSMTMSASEYPVPLRTSMRTGHPLSDAIANAGYSLFGKTDDVARRIWVNDNGATTLGTYEGRSEVSFALRQQGNWNAIYLANAYSPAGVWREIARWAGVHIYNDRNDAFYANASYLTVHANGAGARTLTFPAPKLIYDPFNGSNLASNVNSYALGILTNGETAIIRIAAPSVVAPTITTQPNSSTNLVGTQTSFAVVASGTEPLSYSWFLNGTALPNATMSTFSLSNVQPTNAGNYIVVVTNLAGAATSSVASLTVWLPPDIIRQPTNQTVVRGANVSFNVVAGGTLPLGYQWQFNSTNIPGATLDTLIVTNVQPSASGGYNVLVGNVAGSTNSLVASLMVLIPPAILRQPQSQTNSLGAVVSFSVSAGGSGPLAFQWKHNGTPMVDGGRVSGAMSDSLMLNGLSSSDAGDYYVVVTNLAGSATSEPVKLVVLVPPVLSAINLADHTVSISFDSVAGLSYTLEYKESLDAPSWTSLPPPYSSNGGVIVLTDTNATEAVRFYRVCVQ